MGMKLIETTLDKRNTLVALTKQEVTAMKDVENGTEINYIGHIITEIVNEETGEVFKSITLMDASGVCYATRSETFMKQLSAIIDAAAEFAGESDEPLLIRIVKRKSKNNNVFVTCEFV